MEITNRTNYYVKDLIPKITLSYLESKNVIMYGIGDIDYQIDMYNKYHNNSVFILTKNEVNLEGIYTYKKGNYWVSIIELNKEIINVQKIIEGKYSKAFKKGFVHPTNLGKAVINKNPRILETLRNCIYDINDPDRYIYLNEESEYDSIPEKHEELINYYD
jgi:hypothetical protein